MARIGVALLAWSLVPGAQAEQLRLGDLALTYDSAWQRGEPAAEAEADGPILTLAEPGAGADDLTLYLPRQGTSVREDAQRFADQLAQKWRLRYGATARIETRALDGRDWFTCRRPSRDGRDTVFQWVTLEAGRAYSLVWFSTGARDRLPAAAESLLRGIAFAPPEAATPPPVTQSPATADPAAGWRLDRVVPARPAAGALEALAQVDAQRLPPGSELTGYGLKVDAAGMDWFLEGFRWEPVPPNPEGGGRRMRKSPFRHGGGVSWEGPPPSLGQTPTAVLTWRFDTGLEAGATQGHGPIGLRLQWLDVCVEDSLNPLVQAHMGRGSHAALERLLRRRPQSCPEADVQTLPEPRVIESESAAPDGRLTIALPLPYPLASPPATPGLTRALVLVARPFVSTTEDQPGDALLRQAGVYYLYAPPR